MVFVVFLIMNLCIEAGDTPSSQLTRSGILDSTRRSSAFISVICNAHPMSTLSETLVLCDAQFEGLTSDLIEVASLNKSLPQIRYSITFQVFVFNSSNEKSSLFLERVRKIMIRTKLFD